MASVLEQLNDGLAAIVAEGRRSLVHVRGSGNGAGTLWHPDGLVVTNAHVVRTRGVQVTLADGRTVPARVLATNPARDLAALAVEADGLPVIEPGDSRALQVGDWVVALGHPWGVTGAATAGVVIGVGEAPEMPPDRGDFLQVSLHLRPGHSGGPMLDAHGRLVGINTMMAGPDVGLAVPVYAVKRFLRRALSSQRRPPPESEQEPIAAMVI